MNPNLQYAQQFMALHRRGSESSHNSSFDSSSRRGNAGKLESVDAADNQANQAVFSDYLNWLTTCKNGIEERDAKNNHGTCWGNASGRVLEANWRPAVVGLLPNRFKTVLVPNQIQRRQLPLELRRTKPYSYRFSISKRERLSPDSLNTCG